MADGLYPGGYLASLVVQYIRMMQGGMMSWLPQSSGGLPEARELGSVGFRNMLCSADRLLRVISPLHFIIKVA